LLTHMKNFTKFSTMKMTEAENWLLGEGKKRSDTLWL